MKRRALNRCTGYVGSNTAALKGGTLRRPNSATELLLGNAVHCGIEKEELTDNIIILC